MPFVLLDTVGILFVAVALTILSVALLRAIANVLRAAPLIPNALGDAVEGLGIHLNNFFGQAFSGITHAIGGSFHKMAVFLDESWHAVNKIANVLEQVATVVGNGLYSISGLKGLVHTLTKIVHVVLHRFVTIGKEIHTLQRLVKKLEHDISKGIGEDVLPRLKTLEREVGHVEHRVIPAITGELSDAENAIGNLYDWAKGKASLLGVGTFAFAVSAVLSAVGLDWLACKSRNNVNGKSNCALWDDLANLLGVAVVAGLALDLDKLIHEAQDVTPGIVDGIEKLAGLKS